MWRVARMQGSKGKKIDNRIKAKNFFFNIENLHGSAVTAKNPIQLLKYIWESIHWLFFLLNVSSCFSTLSHSSPISGDTVHDRGFAACSFKKKRRRRKKKKKKKKERKRESSFPGWSWQNTCGKKIHVYVGVFLFSFVSKALISGFTHKLYFDKLFAYGETKRILPAKTDFLMLTQDSVNISK